jgi:hypothetical protein
VRGDGQGVDWYRYQKEIMLKKLIPFAKQCKVERLDTIVQEDGAPCYRHRSQKPVYNLHKIATML